MGANVDEILFADDTIVFARNAACVGSYLRKIQVEGKKYGMKLNENKCEFLGVNNSERI